jgi:hypothetical protein
MRNRFAHLTLVSIFFVTLALSARAQDRGESAPVTVAVVSRATSLRGEASAASAATQSLSAGDELQVLIPRRRAGFLYVITNKGEQGWVRATSVAVRAPSGAGLTTAAATCACPRTFTRCTSQGCACPGTTQAIFNETKRRVPTGEFASARALTFDDFKSLQKQANTILAARGKQPRADLSQEDRDQLRDLSVSGGTVKEGSLVRVVGFISKGEPPHSNTGGESVNCKLGGDSANDFHISLAPAVGLDEFKGIVVEMIPQGRPAGWTLAKLLRARDEKRMTLAVGALFLDNIHVVNANPHASIDGQPKRISIWEVHPIKQFFVCEKVGNACSPDRLADWTPLARF